MSVMLHTSKERLQRVPETQRHGISQRPQSEPGGGDPSWWLLVIPPVRHR